MTDSIRIYRSLEEISADAWNELTGDDNPFVEHHFLNSLEETGCVGPDTGWVPFYVTVFEEDKLAAATFVYLKDQSYGEYIFDWAWADASHRARVPYYPKLVVAAPFTPATGPRLLVGKHTDATRRDALRHLLLDGIAKLQDETKAMSVHFLFCTDEEAGFLSKSGFLRRATHQYHFFNPGYSSFDDFLAQLKSSNRKQIRKERRKCAEGLDITFGPGTDLSPEDKKAIYDLYLETASRKYGRPYLTESFFDETHDGGRSIVGFAKQDGDIIAATLSFAKGKHLYGRYWGARREVPGLHFELCYYQHIEYAIANGMTLVEAGAQGEHKVKRGYLPVVTHSAHRFVVAPLSEAIERFLADEAEAVRSQIGPWRESGPFKADCMPTDNILAGIAED